MSDSNSWMQHAIWIGGASCSGKSTVADTLGARYSLPVVHMDDWLFDIVDVATLESMPAMYWYLTTDRLKWFSESGEIPNKRYIDSLREEMVASMPLLAGAIDSPTIVEGNCFFPDMAEKLSPAGRHVWMVGADHFREYLYDDREWARELIRSSPDRDTLWKNWMSRDAYQAKFVRDTATKLNLEVIEISGQLSVDETADIVAASLGLGRE